MFEKNKKRLKVITAHEEIDLIIVTGKLIVTTKLNKDLISFNKFYKTDDGKNSYKRVGGRIGSQACKGIISLVLEIIKEEGHLKEGDILIPYDEDEQPNE